MTDHYTHIYLTDNLRKHERAVAYMRQLRREARERAARLLANPTGKTK